MLAQSAHHPSSHYPARLFCFSPCLCQSSLMLKTPLVQSTTACQQHHHFMSLPPAGASPLLPCGLWLGQPSHGCISKLLSQGMLQGMLAQSAHHPSSHSPARLFCFSPCLCQSSLMLKTPLVQSTTACQHHHFMSLPPAGASPLLPCGLWLGQPSHGCISNLLSQGHVARHVGSVCSPPIVTLPSSPLPLQLLPLPELPDVQDTASTCNNGLPTSSFHEPASCWRFSSASLRALAWAA